MAGNAVTPWARVVVDFANAKSPEEAGLQFIENTKDAFGFSDEYAHFCRIHFSRRFSPAASALAQEIEKAGRKEEHVHIRNLQEELKDALVHISANGNARNGHAGASSRFRSLAEGFRGLEEYYGRKGEVIPLIEGHYLHQRVMATRGLRPSAVTFALDFYDDMLGHSLFKVIEDQKRFIQCPECGEFFVSDDPKHGCKAVSKTPRRKKSAQGEKRVMNRSTRT